MLLDEKILSFNKFAMICLEMKLFSQEKQTKFAQNLDSNVNIERRNSLLFLKFDYELIM